MSFPSSFVPVSFDPGMPVDVCPTYYWVWVEAVQLYWQSSRDSAPLSYRLDLFPIIGRYYHPRPATMISNHSSYITYLQKKGLLRRFGGSFWVPETEATIRVSGKIVYTPNDLDALLAGEERFQPPSQDTEPVSIEGKEETVEAAQVVEVEVGEEVHELDLPAAEPEVKAKKSRTKRMKSERADMTHKLQQAVWDAAMPTDDPAWRVIAKSVCMQLAINVCGNKLAYSNLYRHGRMKSGLDYNIGLVTDPNRADVSQVSASEQSDLPEKRTEIPATGLCNLALEEIKVRLTGCEASFSTQVLEDERARVLGEIETRSAELAAIDETRLRLREELRVLEASKEAIDGNIDTRIMQRQQDQELQDLNWARDNFARLERVLTGSAAKS